MQQDDFETRPTKDFKNPNTFFERSPFRCDTPELKDWYVISKINPDMLES